VKYQSRSFEVEATRWDDRTAPPPGVHDIWLTHGASVYGYLSTPTGDKIAWLGCWVIEYPSGDKIALSDEEFRLRFNVEEPQ
jgi:hypothetical protein